MDFARNGHRLYSLLVLLPLISFGLSNSPKAQSPEVLAAKYRQQAEQYRSEAVQYRLQIKGLVEKTNEERKLAANARAKAGRARRQGDRAEASKLERSATNHDHEADQLETQTESLRKQADKLERDAIAKEEEAKKLEAASKTPVQIVLAEADATLKKAREDFQNLKTRVQTRFVGQEFAKSGGAFWSTEATYTTYTQAMFDERTKPWEDEFSRIEKAFAADRAAFTAKTSDAGSAAGNAYGRVESAVINLIGAAMDLSKMGWEFHNVPIYRQEKALHDEWEATKKQLRDSDAPYAVVKATMDALEIRQGQQRKPTFDAVAGKWRSDKNYLAFIRHEWISEVNRWHDLAARLSSGNDVHLGAAGEFTNMLEKYFGKKIDLQGFYTFSGRFVNIPYDKYDWCKSVPYPDIQTYKDSPATFGWDDIMNEKLPLQVLGRKDPGAAKEINP